MNDESLTLQLDCENTHVAHHLFQKYSKEGDIPKENIKKMLRDLYGNLLNMNREELSEASQDILEMIDYDNDGKIGFGDIENFVSNYLAEFSHSVIETNNSNYGMANREEKIKLNMSNSFQSFEMDNLEIAHDIFDDYDVDKNGMINRNELTSVIRDVCKSLGVEDAVDKKILEKMILNFEFQIPEKVTWEEFQELYLRHFNF